MNQQSSDERKPFSERRIECKHCHNPIRVSLTDSIHGRGWRHMDGTAFCYIGMNFVAEPEAERPASGSTPVTCEWCERGVVRFELPSGRFAHDVRFTNNTVAHCLKGSTGSVTGSGAVRNEAESGLVPPAGTGAAPEDSPSPQVPAAPSQTDSSVGDGVVTTEVLDEAQSSLREEGTATEHDASSVRHTARRRPGIGDGAAPTADGLLPQDSVLRPPQLCPHKTTVGMCEICESSPSRLSAREFYEKTLFCDDPELKASMKPHFVKFAEAYALAQSAELRKEVAETLQALHDSEIDRTWEDEGLLASARIAVNAVYWRNQKIAKLETELQQVRRELEQVRIALANCYILMQPEGYDCVFISDALGGKPRIHNGKLVLPSAPEKSK